MPTESTSTASRQSIARREFITEGALVIAGVTARSSVALAESNPEISSSEEAIHQRRTFAANRSRVYAALTVEEQFDRIVRLSGVMKADTQANMQHPTKLSTHAGGAFSVFDGYIVGRQLELVPNERIVQAWRVLSWPRGLYSVARFELSEQAGATTIVFDHTGFPKGTAEHLARDGKSITGIRSPKYWHSSLRVC
jgi:activator of HSP90 ATPase